jgi:hypothetical protein
MLRVCKQGKIVFACWLKSNYLYELTAKPQDTSKTNNKLAKACTLLYVYRANVYPLVKLMCKNTL